MWNYTKWNLQLIKYFAGTTTICWKATESWTMFDGRWPRSSVATFIYIACVSHRSCGISAGMLLHFCMICILVVLPPLMALVTFLATFYLCIGEGIYFCSGGSYEINCIKLLVDWYQQRYLQFFTCNTKWILSVFMCHIHAMSKTGQMS